MSRRQPIPLPRTALAIGIAGAALVAVIGSPSTGISPALDARAAAAPTPAPTTSPVAEASPGPTATPESLSSKERRVRAKARSLASSLARDVSGSSRADVRRGILVKFSLGTGRAVVRLQVKSDERWSNVARVQLPRGKGKRTLEPGKEGRKRLASATVVGDRVQARYAVALSDGSIDATAWKSFRLNR